MSNNMRISTDSGIVVTPSHLEVKEGAVTEATVDEIASAKLGKNYNPSSHAIPVQKNLSSADNEELKQTHQNLADQAVESVREDMLSVVVSAAALQGQAVRSGKMVMASQIQTGKKITPKGESVQTVFIEEKGVLKQSEARAKSEEHQVQGLSDILMPSVTVSQARAGPLASVRFGYKPKDLLPPEDRNRLISFSHIPESDMNMDVDSALMRNYMSSLRDAYNNLQDKPSFQRQLQAFDRGECHLDTKFLMDDGTESSLSEEIQNESEIGKAFIYHIHGLDQGFDIPKTVTLENGDTLSFHELQEGLDNNKYNFSMKVGDRTLQQHFEDKTNLGKALTPSLMGQEKYKFEFIPVFTSPEQESDYNACSKSKWKDPVTGESLNFQELQESLLSHNLDPTTTPISQVDKTGGAIEQSAITNALSCEFRFVPPMAMQNINYQIFPLWSPERQTVVKPMIHNMTLYDDLPNKDLVMGRLTTNAEMKALFTLEGQFMDLHQRNIGFVPHLSEEDIVLLKHQYSYKTTDGEEKKDISFNDLLNDLNKVDFTTIDAVNDEGEKVSIDQKQLVSALNCQWDIELFDTDLSLGESNKIQILHKQKSAIPLRSILLTSEWKDKELSADVLNEMKEMDKRVPQAKAWMANEDSAIHQRLDKEHPLFKPFREALSQHLDHYNFGMDYAKDRQSLDELREKFVKDLTQNENHELWTYIRALARPTPRLDDEKVRETLARQLFPRATPKQQEAYLERVSSRQQYLGNYPADLQNVKQILNSESTPLTQYEKEQYLARLDQNPLDAEKFLKDLNDKIKPTYFNLAKAMYPLLKEAWVIEEKLDGDDAGYNIGLTELEDDLEKLEKQTLDPQVLSSVEVLKKTIPLTG